MFRSVLKSVAICAVMLAPIPAYAFDHAQFTSLLQEYQSLCSRMISAPLAFHNDPSGNFGINGEEELYGTDDRANVDYYVETSPPGQVGTRSYGIVSVQVSNLLEQSCQVIDERRAAASDADIAQLANTVHTGFSNAPGFEITGGPRVSDEYSGYFFAVTGLFLDVDVISLITLSGNFMSIEHIHISTFPK